MRRLMIPAVFVMAALGLAGCSASSMPTTGAGVGDSAAIAPAPAGKPAIGANSKTAPETVTNHLVITTGQLTVTVDNPITVADQVAHIVEQAGGRVDDRSQQAPTHGDQGSAWLTVRIPSAGVTTTLEKIKHLGKVQDASLSSKDVTTTSQDLDARISALKTSVERLTALMSKAASVQDLMLVETTLSERQSNLESLQAQHRALADQVDLSTVRVSLVSTADAAVQTPKNFWSGLVLGWQALVTFFAGALVIVGVALPWLLLGGAIAVAILLLLRFLKRRKTARADNSV